MTAESPGKYITVRFKSSSLRDATNNGSFCPSFFPNPCSLISYSLLKANADRAKAKAKATRRDSIDILCRF